jgi:uncharacterized membrane protein
LELYRQVLEKFPDSKQARYAETQVENIEEKPESVREREQADSVRADGGEAVDGASQAAPASRKTGGATEPGDIEVDSKFTALETISGFLKLVAVVNAISTLAAFPIGQEAGAGAAVFVFVTCLISAAVCWTFAEVVLVLPAIEKNTRKVAKLLENRPASRG